MHGFDSGGFDRARHETALRDAARLAALERTGLLDSPPEDAFDWAPRMVARVQRTPVALLSFIDDRRQFVKSAVGLPEPWAAGRSLPLTHSICQHVIVAGAPLAVADL